MSSTFSSVLPKPKSAHKLHEEALTTETPILKASQLAVKVAGPPPYRHRQNFIPRYIDDYGDGGSFPEIHVAQYPLDMGRAKSSSFTDGVLPVQVDSAGRVKYDVIARQGHSKDRVVFSSLKDMMPSSSACDEMAKPSEEEVEKITSETKAALEKIVNVKIKASQPSLVKKGSNDPTLIKYTGSQSGGNFAPIERAVKMVSLPEDPLGPPRFLHKKLPRPPPSPPPPVLHSPPRKVSAKEQLAWKIPPCISNWKNPKGYTIPLDKRMANDGRGMQEVVINDNFAKFAESLYLADQHAREEVEKRAALQQKLLEKERREKEETLRQMAMKAREERVEYESSEDESKGIQEREALRRERQKEREREIRLSRKSMEKQGKLAARDQDRDISEKIALGAAVPTVNRDSIFDARLFNKTEGIASGFNDDDSYDVYDKPLFTGSTANLIYQPAKALEDDNQYSEEKVNKMLSSSKFTKANDPNEVSRSGPVEFQQDPFGLDEFLSQAKQKRDYGINKRKHEDE